MKSPSKIRFCFLAQRVPQLPKTLKVILPRGFSSTPAVLILLQPKEARLITFRVESKNPLFVK